MTWNKKAKLDWSSNFVEYMAFVLLGLGFLISSALGTSWLSYIMIFIFGLIGGRIWYSYQGVVRTRWAFLLIFFIIGYTFGSFWGIRWLIMSLYVAGLFTGNYLHIQKWIKSI